jgi:hypothetical protein
MKAITLISAVLISAFLLTGVADKVLHWNMFVVTLGKNPLIPAVLAGAVAGGVIAVETIVAVALLPGPTRRMGMLLATILFAFFSVVVALLFWLAPSTQCGCSFTAGFDTPTVRHLLLNVLITILCGYLCIIGFRRTPANTGAPAPGAAITTPPTTSHPRSEP